MTRSRFSFERIVAAVTHGAFAERLQRVQAHIAREEWDLARAALTGFVGLSLTQLEAAEWVVLEARMPNAAPDLDELEPSGALLLRAKRFDLALDAFCAAGLSCGDDVERARKNYASAVLCSELASRRSVGPTRLLALASLALRSGAFEQAAAFCRSALTRLDGVSSPRARRDEARAFELLGDATAART